MTSRQNVAADTDPGPTGTDPTDADPVDLTVTGPLTALCGAHCGTDSRGTAHCPQCHAGLCPAAKPQPEEGTRDDRT